MAEFIGRLFRSPSAVIGLFILLAVAAIAVAAPLLYPAGPWAMVGQPMQWPGQVAGLPLGTDALGRDIMAGIFHGARISLLIGLAATAAALCIGVAVGAVAGFFGGWVDDVLMRITDAFQTIPPFILAIVIVVIVNPSVSTIILAIAAISWPAIARLVRAEFLRLREMDFVASCRLIGMGNTRIILTQILPNALPPIIVTASILTATAILTEAGLSFLGLGDPNVISWGTMIGMGRSDFRAAWYLVAIPGMAVVLTVLALNLLGDGLNDALNTRLHRRK
ncbi:MAG: ABC transporter permease [Pararhodobacter sp.]|nr:ABC transporter permease [Pararhodobacter sp.]